MAIISAFQAEDTGSTPVTRSLKKQGLPKPCFSLSLNGVELGMDNITKMCYISKLQIQ